MDSAANDLPKMELTPVGFVRSDIKLPILHAGDSDLELRERMDRMQGHQKTIENNVSELVILPELVDLLDGVDGFSHILVLYWPHLIAPERRSLLKVHPMGRKDLPMQGIFATCSPARPNPVLVSAVRLLEKKDNVLRVKGLEAVDGSPILDIKPYLRHYYGEEHTSVPQWMEQIQRELEDDADPDSENTNQS